MAAGDELEGGRGSAVVHNNPPQGQAREGKQGGRRWRTAPLEAPGAHAPPERTWPCARPCAACHPLRAREAPHTLPRGSKPAASYSRRRRRS